MALDTHVAAGQCQSHALRLRRNERIERIGGFFMIDYLPGVFHCYRNLIAVTPGSDAQIPSSLFVTVHRLDCIVDQIDNDRLQLAAMADDIWQSSCQLCAGYNTMYFQLFSQDA